MNYEDVQKLIHPKVDEGYCRICTDYRKDVCVICHRCVRCGHKQTCPENEAVR